MRKFNKPTIGQFLNCLEVLIWIRKVQGKRKGYVSSETIQALKDVEFSLRTEYIGDFDTLIQRLYKHKYILLMLLQ